MKTLPPVPGVTPGNWAQRLLDWIKQSGHAILSGWETHVYGNSYAAFNQAWYTTGEHWTQLLATALDGGTVTSYGQGGARVINYLGNLLNQATFPNTGVTPPADSYWPGTTGRPGVLVLDGPFNDYGHYSSAASSTPVAITTANTRYIDGVKGMYRQVLALMSSETRIEQSAGTHSAAPAWGASQNVSTSYASGGGGTGNGSLSWTTVAGAYIDFASVTPAQSGPLAGKVYICSLTLDPALGFNMSQIRVTIDPAGAATQTTHTVNEWEQYTGSGNVNIAGLCIAVDVPVDGSAHTIRVEQNGAGGDLMYVDCLLIPSTDPNPILFMDSFPPNTGTWNAAQVATWKANYALLAPYLMDVVAEFPNAIWVPSTMTSNGMYSVDGFHPNDRGMHQRSNDAEIALRAALPRLRSRVLATEPDASFGVI